MVHYVESLLCFVTCILRDRPLMLRARITAMNPSNSSVYIYPWTEHNVARLLTVA